MPAEGVPEIYRGRALQACCRPASRVQDEAFVCLGARGSRRDRNFRSAEGA